MIDQVKGAAADTIKSMADINPFMGVMFVAFVAVMIWMAWQSNKASDRSQEAQERFIELQTKEAEREIQRFIRIDKLLAIVSDLEKKSAEEREYFSKKLGILKTIDKKLDACVARGN